VFFYYTRFNPGI